MLTLGSVFGQFEILYNWLIGIVVGGAILLWMVNRVAGRYFDKLWSKFEGWFVIHVISKVLVGIKCMMQPMILICFGFAIVLIGLITIVYGAFRLSSLVAAGPSASLPENPVIETRPAPQDIAPPIPPVTNSSSTNYEREIAKRDAEIRRLQRPHEYIFPEGKILKRKLVKQQAEEIILKLDQISDAFVKIGNFPVFEYFPDLLAGVRGVQHREQSLSDRQKKSEEAVNEIGAAIFKIRSVMDDVKYGDEFKSLLVGDGDQGDPLLDFKNSIEGYAFRVRELNSRSPIPDAEFIGLYLGGSLGSLRTANLKFTSWSQGIFDRIKQFRGELQAFL